MDHAFAVRVADRVGDRDHVRQHLEPFAQRLALDDELLERAPLDELHHVIRIAVRPAPRLVHRDDAGGLEARGDQCLAHEARFVRVAGAKQLLHRDRAAEPLVDRTDHATQPAARVLGDLLVALRVVDRRGRLPLLGLGHRRRAGREGLRAVRWGGHTGPGWQPTPPFTDSHDLRSVDAVPSEMTCFCYSPSIQSAAMRNVAVILMVAGCGPSPAHHPDAPPPDTPIVDTPPADMSRVYAHSGGKLYRVDTQTLMPVEIGSMGGLGTQSLTDLAIDKSDRMVGITLD